MKWFKYVTIGSMFLNWFMVAAEDGRITKKEIMKFLKQVCRQLDIPDISLVD